MRLAGFKVDCVVSDMGTPNQQLFKELGVNADKPTFSVDEEDVVALHDVPHLMKCLRNTAEERHHRRREDGILEAHP